MYDVVIEKFTFAVSSPDEFLLNFGPHHVFGTDEVRQFKFGVQTDIVEYWRMRNRFIQRDVFSVTWPL